MKETIRLLRGAASTKNSMLYISNGRIQCFESRYTIDVPCSYLNKSYKVLVPADSFIKAVSACRFEPEIKLTPKFMMLKKGGFKARLPLGDPDTFPRVENIEHHQQINQYHVLDILKRLKPFVGDPNTDSFISSVLFDKCFAYATCNSIMVKIPAENTLNIAFPSFLVDELIRINKKILHITKQNEVLYFEFDDNTWIKSAMLSRLWPDPEKHFNKIDTSNLVEIPENLKESIKQITPFCKDSDFPVINFNEKGISTDNNDIAAKVEEFDLPISRWHAGVLSRVLLDATRWNLNSYPKPCYFEGENIEGIVMGLKM